MSIGVALSNALSGLAVTARGVETTSNNVANALTEGYARRELEIAAREAGGQGQGVRVLGVKRMVDMTLVGDRRLADAASGQKATRAAFFGNLGDRLGETGEGSLLARTAAFESALAQAGSRPDSTARLGTVLDTARALATSLNAASSSLDDARTQADASIAKQVNQLNGTLARVKDLNTEITAVRTIGRDTSALEDERQRLVDSIAEIVPVREIARDHGQIALFTAGGVALLDGRAAEFGFSPTVVVGVAASVADGSLSGLTLDGHPLEVSGESSMMAGGSLAAAFSVRDELAPAEQARLDALARDLIGRLAEPSVDPTLVAGDAGLFTDRGLAFDPANEVGLAGRISVNALVDPAEGGALWRLRDGLNALSEGAAGDATLLNALASALGAAHVPASGPYTGSYSFSELAAEAVSSVSTAGLAADREASFTAARRDELHALELADGVDTDQEMEHLLLLQQAYAANAKVVTAADDMINRLLEM